MRENNLTSLFLRIGLAFVFLYAAFGAITSPENWIGYFPTFLHKLLPDNLILSFFSFYELFLAMWLLSGKKIVYPAILASLTMIGIIISNIGISDVVFRDVAIFFMGLALATLSKD